jgi:hypothetical protein
MLRRCWRTLANFVKLDKFPRVSKKCLKNSEDVAKKIGRLQGHQKNIEKM